MAHSYKIRWANTVQAYTRLKIRYDALATQRDEFAEEIRDLRAEVRRLEKDAKARDRASRRTMANLFDSTRYAITHLHNAGDTAGAAQLGEWLLVMEENMQPVANVAQLVELLHEWVAAMPCDDPTKLGPLYMRTLMEINDFGSQS